MRRLLHRVKVKGGGQKAIDIASAALMEHAGRFGPKGVEQYTVEHIEGDTYGSFYEDPK